MEVLWRSDAEMNTVGHEVRLVNLDGDLMFETAMGENVSFFCRLKYCLSYLFGKRPVVLGSVMVDDSFKEVCRKVVENDRKNC